MYLLIVMCLGCEEISPSIGKVRCKHHGVLVHLKGTVIRSGMVKDDGGGKTVSVCHVQREVFASSCYFICFTYYSHFYVFFYHSRSVRG